MKQKNHFVALNIGLFHTNKVCLKHAVWDKGICRCNSCHRLIALAYRFGNDIRFWRTPHFRSAQLDYNEQRDGVMENISFDDFDEYIRDGLKMDTYLSAETPMGFETESEVADGMV